MPADKMKCTSTVLALFALAATIPMVRALPIAEDPSSAHKVRTLPIVKDSSGIEEGRDLIGRRKTRNEKKKKRFRNGSRGIDPASMMGVPQWQQDAQNAFLARGCQSSSPSTGLRDLLAHLACERRGLIDSVETVPDNAYDNRFDDMWLLEDSADFDALEVLSVLFFADNSNAREGGGGDDNTDYHPAISDTFRSKAKEALLNFKYWYTDPTPDRIYKDEQVVDTMWYWTENHVLAYHVCELLAGQLFPDETFALTGMKGSGHQSRASEWLREWIYQRSRFGFTEWHSDVYYMKDIQALLLLVEHSDNTELVRLGTMVLDILFLDVALHWYNGMFGATHGRSYAKDKATGRNQDIYKVAMILFGDPLDIEDGGVGNGVFIASSEKYGLPEVIQKIAQYDGPMVDRERMNIPLKIEPPASFYAEQDPAPFGFSYNDRKDLPLWWSMNAMTAWPLLPMTIDVANEYGLWNQLLGGGDFDLESMGLWQIITKSLLFRYLVYKHIWPVLNAAILEQVNTYTYRTKDYMLSTCQDYHPGIRSNQVHTWQATLSESAVVFTTHPAKLAVEDGGGGGSTSFNWRNDEPGPGYWTGEGSRPRAAQYRNVGIYIYAPQYETQLFNVFDQEYREETHAYFPVSHFDEVDQSGQWTFGRKGDGYIALFSHLPTTWRNSQPELHENGGDNFDLVAEGNAQNVWIVELGSASEYNNFETFRQYILSTVITVTEVENQETAFKYGSDMVHDVIYESPSSERVISFGWHSPLRVNGETIPLDGYKRFDNTFVQTDFGSTRYEISFFDGPSLLIDFDSITRIAK